MEDCPESNRRRPAVSLALAVVSSALVSVAFPPFDLGFCAWFGLAPLLYALRRGKYAESCLLGILFGILFAVGGLYWTLNIEAFHILDFCICAVYIGLYFLLFGLLYRLISSASGGWGVIGAPSLWVTLEYVRSNLSFLSFPWNLLGQSQYEWLPVIQIADLTGVYGVTFLVVMVNELLSRLPDALASHDDGRAVAGRLTAWKRLACQAVFVAVTMAMVIGYGWRQRSVPDGDRRVRVALVQANLVVRDDMPFAGQVEHYRTYDRLTREAAGRKPDLIVWPSSSMPAAITDRLTRMSVMRTARASGAYLLTGGAGHKKDRPRKEGDLPYSNSEFLFSPAGWLVGQYNKVRLLPFNEYLPLKDRFRWPGWITKLRDSFIPGSEYTVFRLPGGNFSTPICWENMFPDMFRRFVDGGAQFMVTVTNEAFFGGDPAPYRQSLAINVFRAVENRIAVARSAPTGISAFIRPDGEIVGRVRDGGGKDLNVAGILVHDIPLIERKTFYTVHGDLFARLCIGLTLLTVLASLVVELRDRSPGRNRGLG